MSEDLDKFKLVCPACSEVFDADSDYIGGYDDENSFHARFVRIECPVCGHVQTI